ncbi:hypothetical protein HK102_014059, partial [Quaeritorhiza haematococci]
TTTIIASTMPYVYCTPREMNYPTILGGASRIPDNICLHRSDLTNNQDYVQELLGLPLGVRFYFPALRGNWCGGGAGTGSDVCSDGRHAAGGGDSDIGAALKGVLGQDVSGLAPDNCDGGTMSEARLSKTLYHLAFKVLSEFLEWKGMEEMVARNLMEFLGWDLRPRASSLSQFKVRLWDGELRDLKKVLVALVEGVLGGLQTMFERTLVEEEHIMQAFVISHQDGEEYCRQHLIPPETVTFGDNNIIFNLRGTMDGIELFRPVVQRMVFPGKRGWDMLQWGPVDSKVLRSSGRNQESGGGGGGQLGHEEVFPWEY